MMSDDNIYLYRQQRATELLQAMNENQLTETIVIPFFRRKGWICTKVDKQHEDEHCCDVLISLPGREDEILNGVQVKNKVDIKSGRYVTRHLRPYPIAALDYAHKRGKRESTINVVYAQGAPFHAFLLLAAEMK